MLILYPAIKAGFACFAQAQNKLNKKQTTKQTNKKGQKWKQLKISIYIYIYISIALLAFSACGGGGGSPTNKALRDAVDKGSQIIPYQITLALKQIKTPLVNETAKTDYGKQNVLITHSASDTHIGKLNEILDYMRQANFHKHIKDGKFVAYVQRDTYDGGYRLLETKKIVIESKYDSDDNLNVNFYQYNPITDANTLAAEWRLYITANIIIKSAISDSKPFGEFDLSWVSSFYDTRFSNSQPPITKSYTGKNNPNGAISVSGKNGVGKIVGKFYDKNQEFVLESNPKAKDFKFYFKDNKQNTKAIAHDNGKYIAVTKDGANYKYFDSNKIYENVTSYKIFAKDDKKAFQRPATDYEFLHTYYKHDNSNDRNGDYRVTIWNILLEQQQLHLTMMKLI